MYERLFQNHMPERIVILVLVLAGLFVTAVLPASAADVVRTVDAGQNGNYQVHLSFSGDPVIGVTERLPSGASLLSCSLPQEQWNLAGENLYLAVLGEPSITYAITVKESGELSGKWVDLSDGSTGNLPQVLLGPEGGVEGASPDATSAATGNTPVPTKSEPPVPTDTALIATMVPQPTRAGTVSGILAVSLTALAIAGTLVRRRSH
jgi:hypothetical protein